MKTVYRSDSTYYDKKKNLKKRIKKRVHKKDDRFKAIYLYEKYDNVKKITVSIPFNSHKYSIQIKENGIKSTQTYDKNDLSPIYDDLDFVIEYINLIE